MICRLTPALKDETSGEDRPCSTAVSCSSDQLLKGIAEWLLCSIATRGAIPFSRFPPNGGSGNRSGRSPAALRATHSCRFYCASFPFPSAGFARIHGFPLLYGCFTGAVLYPPPRTPWPSLGASSFWRRSRRNIGILKTVFWTSTQHLFAQNT